MSTVMPRLESMQSFTIVWIGPTCTNPKLSDTNMFKTVLKSQSHEKQNKHDTDGR
jgi:hypothetical protein